MNSLLTLSAISIVASAIRLDANNSTQDLGSNVQMPASNEKTGDYLQRFAAWVAKNGKDYKDANEHNKRFEAWFKKDQEYAALNQNPENTFVLGHSAISDLFPEEFAALLLPS